MNLRTPTTLRFACLLLVFWSAMLLGCGPSRPATAPVSGTVLLDGEPLADAAVTFTPTAGGRPAYGATDADGHFRLSTFSEGDGAILGEHIATIYKEEADDAILDEGNLAGEPADPSPAMPELLVPAQYTRVETCPLRFNVTNDTAPIEIALSAE